MYIHMFTHVAVCCHSSGSLKDVCMYVCMYSMHACNYICAKRLCMHVYACTAAYVCKCVAVVANYMLCCSM